MRKLNLILNHFQLNQRENYIRQLQPTHRPIDRLHIRLLGHCASGKSSLINSLKSGIFSFGFFRRSRSQNYSAKVGACDKKCKIINE